MTYSEERVGRSHDEVRERAEESFAYEPPDVAVIGTLAELTSGTIGVGDDLNEEASTL